MGKRQVKREAVWMQLLRGTVLALVVYLTGAAVLALLLVRGMIPETVVFPVLAMLCFLAAFLDAAFSAGNLPWGSLPSAMLAVLFFAGTLIAVGAACWQGITWTENGGILLLSAAGAGFFAALLSGRRKKGKRRRKK